MKRVSEDLVSVIIPNFNYGLFIHEAIRSVLDQSYKNIEVVVIDDGSTDDSVEQLRKYGRKITLIESKNQGSCVARNLGLLNSSGDYIAYLDSDDSWYEEKIELQLEFLQKSKAELVFCRMRSIEPCPILENTDIPMVIDHDWFINHPGATPFAPSSVLMTQNLAARVGGWNTSLSGPAEDFDYFRRCAKFGQICGLEQTLVHHRQHSSSLTSSGAKRYFEDNLRVTRLMLVEDRVEIRRAKRFRILLRLHFNFLKHAVKTRDILLFFAVCQSIVWN